MKLLFVADLHIKLGQKNVPKDWQYNRFMLLSDKINEFNPDFTIIGGDLLDVAKPSVEEIGLMYDFLSAIRGEKLLIPGNHEMVSKKKDCFVPIKGILNSTNTTLINEFTTWNGFDFIPYNILHDKTWPKPRSKFAITHVRGEIPPHVQPEIDLSRFNQYDKVFTGDLHSYQNCQGNLYYPGSPFTTSFHRSISNDSNGIFIIDSNTGDHMWHSCGLPSLVRRTVSNEHEMVATDYHHTIYELEGDLDDLAKVQNSELLDKKVTKNVSTPPSLDLSGSINDELGMYLKEINKLPEDKVKRLLTRFKDVYLHDSD